VSTRSLSRRRITALFVAFEASTPLVGLALGAPLAHAIGDVAEYAAGVVLIAVGAWMLFGGDEEREEQQVRSFSEASGVALLALGCRSAWTSWPSASHSGCRSCRYRPSSRRSPSRRPSRHSSGNARGARLSERSREAAEKAAGVALAALGVYLVIAQVVR
jgi:cytochrome c biogenesis protein CcdA